MPKNLGLYNDVLSTPRKKDVTAVETSVANLSSSIDTKLEEKYGADNPPPYPVTSVNGQTGDVTVEAELPDNLVEYDALGEISATEQINADTLQGHNAAYFATQTGLSTLQNDVDEKVSLSGGTMTGALKAYNSGNSIAQVRNIIISADEPTEFSDGDIWIKI